jgi:histone-binding protein RBBP4
VMGSANE